MPQLTAQAMPKELYAVPNLEILTASGIFCMQNKYTFPFYDYIRWLNRKHRAIYYTKSFGVFYWEGKETDKKNEHPCVYFKFTTYL